MTDWSASIVAQSLHGRWLREAAEKPCGASIDTRSLEPGNVFFALRGEHADGHDFLGAAASAGASICVVDHDDVDMPKGRCGVLLVEDARRALALLAAAWRDRLRSTRVIGVTGSAGKTTTVRLLDAALGRTMRGIASRRSFNNDLGVPLTLLNASDFHEYVICEIGSNAPGEIDALSRIVRPDIGVVTAVGRAHLAGFGSVEGVAREKAAITAHMRPGGCAVLNADAPLLLSAVTSGTPVRTFGHAEHADLRVVDARHEGRMLNVALHDGTRLHLPLAGRHNATNGAAALLVARLLGLDDGPVIQGLASARGAERRLEVEDLPTDPPIRLIDDAYNANPESMLAALSTLCEIGVGAPRRVAIIGDMLELGDHAQGAHREIVRRIAALPIELTVLIGPAFSEAGSPDSGGARTVVVTDLGDESVANVAGHIQPGDVVLVKASRGLRLERVSTEIRRRFAMADAASADNR